MFIWIFLFLSTPVTLTDDALRCHKIILSAASPVFDKLLSSRSEENEIEISDGIFRSTTDVEVAGSLRTLITLSGNVTFDELRRLVKFVYTGGGDDIQPRLVTLFKVKQPAVRRNAFLMPACELAGAEHYKSGIYVTIYLMLNLKFWWISYLKIMAENGKVFFVSKLLMTARCDFIRWTMNNDFLERQTKTVLTLISEK